MGYVELAGSGARLPPGREKLAILVEFHHARIAVAVGYIKIAVGCPSDIRGLVEGLVVGSGFTFDAQGHQQLAVPSEFVHLVIAVVDAPDVVVLVGPDAVRITEEPAAPRSQELTLAVVYHDRIGLLASLEDVDVAFRIGGDRGNA